MDKSTAAGTHPALFEIIGQLTPNEAKIVTLFLYEMAFPIINVRRQYKNPTPGRTGGVYMLVNYSHPGELAGCEFEHFTPSYIDNLCRLGLADVPSIFQYTAQGVHEPLKNSPVIIQIKADIEANPEFMPQIERRGLLVT